MKNNRIIHTIWSPNVCVVYGRIYCLWRFDEHFLAEAQKKAVLECERGGFIWDLKHFK